MTRALVVGIGGIGGWLLARLTQNGADVSGWTRGETYERLAAGAPLKLVSHEGDWSGPVRVTADTPTEPYELTFLCTKSMDTDMIGRQLPIGGVVVSVQNGIDNAETLRALGHNAVATVVYSACERVGPTTIAHRSNGMLITDDRAVATYLIDHGIAAKVTDDLRTALWRKLLANVVVNSFCALLRQPMGGLIDNPALVGPIRAVVAEVCAVARSEGAELPEDEADGWPQNLARADPATRPSTLQDVEAGRPLEVDALSGAVLRRADAAGIETPTLITIDALLRAQSWRA